METKIKENKNSKLFIQILDKEEIDQFGEKHIHSHWKEAVNDVDLGSYNDPNKKILGWKYDVPSDDKDNVFKKMFGG